MYISLHQQTASIDDGHTYHGQPIYQKTLLHKQATCWNQKQAVDSFVPAKRVPELSLYSSLRCLFLVS